MGLLETGVGILERLHFSFLLPALDIGVEGRAELCDSSHGIILPSGAAPEEPRGDLHIDVGIGTWNKGQRPVAVNGLDRAEAADQELTEASAIFAPMPLQPGLPREFQYLQLEPKDGSPLAARAGDRLELRFALGRNGRDRRVSWEIHDRPGRSSD